jgi:hypothetical protein
MDAYAHSLPWLTRVSRVPILLVNGAMEAANPSGMRSIRRLWVSMLGPYHRCGKFAVGPSKSLEGGQAMGILAGRLPWWTALFLILSSAPVEGAQVRELDLALSPPGTVATRPARPDDYAFILKNTVVNASYAVTVERELVPIAALVSPFSTRETAQAQPPDRNACDELIAEFVTEVTLATSEGAVKSIVDEVQKDPRQTECTAIQKARLESRIKELTTRPISDTYDLLQGELLRVIVERTDDSTKRWTFVFTTGERGHWETIYGFTFVPDLDERYHTRPIANSSEFEIVKDRNREELDFVPSFMFRWMRSEPVQTTKMGKRKEPTEWSDGFLAGLGFDSAHPVVFAGWGWTYAENVTLTIGLAIHEQQRLDGKYKRGDKVKENLTTEQLSKPTFGPNAFVGVAFRFGTNVHAERAKAQKEAAEAREAAQKVAAEKEAAVKKATEEAAKSQALCIAKEEAGRLEAVGKCTQTDPTAREHCIAVAEAAEAVAKAQCAVDELKRGEAQQAAAAAQQKAQETAAKLAAKKDACFKAAEAAEAATKAGCPAATKAKCEADAAKTAADARMKCLQDFGG